MLEAYSGILYEKPCDIQRWQWPLGHTEVRRHDQPREAKTINFPLLGHSTPQIQTDDATAYMDSNIPRYRFANSERT